MRGLLIHSRGDEPALLAASLRSAANAGNAVDPGAVIHVVVQGPLVRFLVHGSPLANQVQETLRTPEYAILACENSMHSADVTATDLLAGVGTVPSAVAYLAEQQWSGWAYVAI